MFTKSVIYGEPPVLKTELKNVTIYDARKQSPGEEIPNEPNLLPIDKIRPVILLLHIFL